MYSSERLERSEEVLFRETRAKVLGKNCKNTPTGETRPGAPFHDDEGLSEDPFNE